MANEPLLEGDWASLSAELEAFRRSISKSRIVYDEVTANTSGHPLNTKAADIFKRHIRFRSDRPVGLYIVGAGGGSSLDYSDLAAIALLLFKYNPEGLTELCQVGFQSGKCPMRVFVDLGSRVENAEFEDGLEVVAPSPASWWERSAAFDDPVPLGSDKTSRLQYEFEADFMLLEMGDTEILNNLNSGNTAIRDAYIKLECAFLALGLCRDKPTQIFWTYPTTQNIRWSTALGTASSVRIIGRASTDYIKLTDEEIATARKIYSAALDAKVDDIKRIWIPATRLFRASARNTGVDELIDIRTALEAFYVDNDKDELIHRVSTRVAKLGTTSLEGRRAIYRKVKRVYSWGSAAVHAGRFPKRFSQSDFNDVASLLKEQILSALENGIPDLETIDLV